MTECLNKFQMCWKSVFNILASGMGNQWLTRATSDSFFGSTESSLFAMVTDYPMILMWIEINKDMCIMPDFNEMRCETKKRKGWARKGDIEEFFLLWFPENPHSKRLPIWYPITIQIFAAQISYSWISENHSVPFCTDFESMDQILQPPKLIHGCVGLLVGNCNRREQM